MYEKLIESMNKKAIELLEQSPNCDGTGREMRFVGGDVPILASSSKQLASSEWIPVTERLPDEDEGVVLVYSGCVEPAVFSGDIFLEYDKYEGWEIYGVTHWMPLPEAPKGESK